MTVGGCAAPLAVATASAFTCADMSLELMGSTIPSTMDGMGRPGRAGFSKGLALSGKGARGAGDTTGAR